jgi:predicted nuclease of predicted toxin-antitoxin system
VIPLLADENFPLASVAWLRGEGFDVTAISELAPGALDGDVLRMARETGRVLLTFDRDFGELVYRELAPVPSGIVSLRVTAHTPEYPGQLVARLLSDSSVQVVGRCSVVTRDGVRQRPLG